MCPTLAHLLDADLLREAYRRTSQASAAGSDGVRATQDTAHLDENLRALHERLRSGGSQAAPIERVWIEQAEGGQHPLGQPAVEDKMVQRAGARRLEASYAPDLHDGSDGFRQGRSPPEARRARREQGMTERSGGIVEADVRGSFDSIARARLRDVLRTRVNDGRIVRLIGQGMLLDPFCR